MRKKDLSTAQNKLLSNQEPGTNVDVNNRILTIIIIITKYWSIVRLI